MACICDLVDIQAALCIRHFIDFFKQATLKEHNEALLDQMMTSLKLYNEHSAYFENISKVRKHKAVFHNNIHCH